MSSLNKSANTTENEQNNTGYKDSDLYSCSSAHCENSKCQLLLLIVGILHILFSICKPLSLPHYTQPFFKLLTDTELSPMFFDLINTLLFLFCFTFDEGKFLLCLLQFCIYCSKFSAIFLGRHAIVQSVGAHFLRFFESGKPIRQGLKALQTSFQLRSCCTKLCF